MNCTLCCPDWPQSKVERKRKEGISTSTFKGIEKKKKLWNMKVAAVQIVIGAFGTVTKGLLKGLEN